LVVAQHASAGRLRALAVTSARPSTLAATSRPIIQSLNQFLQQLLESADVQEKFLSIGVEVTPGPPENLTALVKADMARFGKVIKDAGIGSK
jgi:tripartite-type tricarboxylate transporter receptor subunit TctC